MRYFLLEQENRYSCNMAADDPRDLEDLWEETDVVNCRARNCTSKDDIPPYIFWAVYTSRYHIVSLEMRNILKEWEPDLLFRSCAIASKDEKIQSGYFVKVPDIACLHANAPMRGGMPTKIMLDSRKIKEAQVFKIDTLPRSFVVTLDILEALLHNNVVPLSFTELEVL